MSNVVSYFDSHDSFRFPADTVNECDTKLSEST